MDQNIGNKSISNEVQKAKKSKLALISLILGALYLLFIITYFTNTGLNSTDSAEAIGAGIATMLVLPHIICTAIALLFNILGYVMNKKNFILVAAILYCVSMILFIMYFMFVIVEAILCFVAYAKMKN